MKLHDGAILVNTPDRIGVTVASTSTFTFPFALALTSSFKFESEADAAETFTGATSAFLLTCTEYMFTFALFATIALHSTL